MMIVDRDNLVNFSQVLAATSNLCAVVLAALPVLVAEVPDWLTGPLVILVTTVGTAILTLAAALDPIMSFFGAVTAVGGQLATCLGLGGVAGRTLATGRNIIQNKLQVIFLGRAKAAAARQLAKEKAKQAAAAQTEKEEEAESGELGHRLQGIVSKRGHFNSHFRRRVFVLERDVLNYYKEEDMVIVHNVYCTGTVIIFACECYRTADVELASIKSLQAHW